MPSVLYQLSPLVQVCSRSWTTRRPPSAASRRRMRRRSSWRGRARHSMSRYGSHTMEDDRGVIVLDRITVFVAGPRVLRAVRGSGGADQGRDECGCSGESRSRSSVAHGHQWGWRRQHEKVRYALDGLSSSDFICLVGGKFVLFKREQWSSVWKCAETINH